jgi:hypothetical protein
MHYFVTAVQEINFLYLVYCALPPYIEMITFTFKLPGGDPRLHRTNAA